MPKNLRPEYIWPTSDIKSEKCTEGCKICKSYTSVAMATLVYAELVIITFTNLSKVLVHRNSYLLILCLQCASVDEKNTDISPDCHGQK